MNDDVSSVCDYDVWLWEDKTNVIPNIGVCKRFMALLIAHHACMLRLP